MAGTTPVAANLSMDDLAATLTTKEQLDLERVTGLTADTTQARNLVATVNDDTDLGPLAICASGAASSGTKLLSTTAYILGSKQAVDLYRRS